MEQNIKLFKMLYDCFINDEDGNEIKVAKDKNYRFKFGNFSNGGWPMIFIPEKNDWFDFCMYNDGTADWDEKPEQIAIEVTKEATNSDVISRKATSDFLREHAKSFNDAKVRIIFESAAFLVENPDNIPPVTEVQESKPANVIEKENVEKAIKEIKDKSYLTYDDNPRRVLDEECVLEILKRNVGL